MGENTMYITVKELAQKINNFERFKPEELKQEQSGKIPTYTNCKTVNTGLYKPHTIYISSGISIVYYERNKKLYNDLVAVAIDTNNNRYEIYKTNTVYGSIGFLAFPVEPDKIKGFYPYL